MKTLLPIVLVAGLLGVQGARAVTYPGPTSGSAQDEATPSAPDAPAAEAASTGGGATADASTVALQTDLNEIIGRPGWTGDEWGVMVVSLDNGDTLFARDPAQALAPASNMKLFTTAAGLYYLGADFRYNTFLMATGPISDGVLDGDLVVYGTGDPTFSNRFGDRLDVWQAFADTLRILGVREIRGDVVGDGSYFDGPGSGEGWHDSYMNAAYAASAGALSFSENVAMLQISPADAAGWRPEVELVPGGRGIAVVNQALTTAGGGTRITVRRIAYDGPVLVTGQIGRGASSLLRSVPVSDPARFAAGMFREMLERSDITVTGRVRSAMTEGESVVTGRSAFAPAFDAEPLRVLAVHTSPPLSRILEIINKRSHNMMAEQVLRTVGRVAVGDGSVEGGARAVVAMMEREGHAPDALAIRDGSGLSVLNRASAGTIVELLALMAESPAWDQYHETLPEAGASDGLRRMYRTGAERNLRAKTGTIDNVSALSGYVTSANGERLAFAIIANNVPSTWMAKRVEDAIGARLAGFSRPRTAVAAAPKPDTSKRDTVTAAAARARSAADTAAQRAEAVAAESESDPTAGEQARTHTVRSGDTLDGIAKRYGTTVRALEQANPGLNPRRLMPGQTIQIR